MARRSGLPLWRLLSGNDARVAVYASGINPDQPVPTAERMRAQGFTAFKLKVGFGIETDLANLRAMRGFLGDATPLMVDANQAWQPDEALRHGVAFAEYRPLWLEEPIAADQPWSAWRSLAQACPIALAAGENMRGDAQFDAALASQALGFVQPDVGKWGGVTGCIRVARKAQVAGVTYCPHWLGSAIGLVTSLHLKAAVAGPGSVEIDANPNPLREAFSDWIPKVLHGCITLTEAAGMGVEPSSRLLSQYLSWRGEHETGRGGLTHCGES